MATWHSAPWQAIAGNVGAVGVAHSIGTLGKDLIATVASKYHSQSLAIDVLPDHPPNSCGRQARLGPHVTLHQVAVDQFVPVALWHGQQLLWSMLPICLRRNRLCLESGCAHWLLPGSFSCS